MAFIAVFVGAVVIPLVSWYIVGARRQRDSLLLPALMLALGFSIGGLAGLFEADLRLDWKLGIGLICFAVFARRWKQSSVASGPEQPER